MTVFFIILQSQNIAIENCTLTIDTSTPSFDSLPPTSPENFQVIELDPSTGSKCLDGSNYKFLFSRGSDSGFDKFMFNFIGGAFCGVEGYDTLESCYYRSMNVLGSSNTWGSNGSIVDVKQRLGYFSSNQNENPLFWNWNRIMINYCDGSNHQGYVEEPYIFNGVQLWFRGYNNTMSTLEYMRDNYDLFNATEIIISGGSAGGQATYIWSSYLQDYFPDNIKFMAIPDAGLFLDVYNNDTNCNLFRYLNWKIANLTNSAQLDLFRKCQYQDEIWKCLLPEYILQDINIPVFIINSQDDSEAMRTQYGVKCVVNPEECTSNEKAQIEQFRQKFLQIINFTQTTKENWGFWLRTCFDHVYQSTNAWYSEEYDVYSITLERWYNLQFALKFWYNGGNLRETVDSAFIDEMNWEDNPYCDAEEKESFIEEQETDMIYEIYGALVFMGLGLIGYWLLLSKLSECIVDNNKTQEEEALIEK